MRVRAVLGVVLGAAGCGTLTNLESPAPSPPGGGRSTLPVRDAVDARIVNEVQTGGGRIIDHVEEVGGFPVIPGGTAPPDTDHDGLPDAWESSRGLNPNDPSDGPADPDGDGYTNLEDYLHSL